MHLFTLILNVLDFSINVYWYLVMLAPIFSYNACAEPTCLVPEFGGVLAGLSCVRRVLRVATFGFENVRRHNDNG